MPKVGTLGLDMMFRTCTVQVTVIFSFVFMGRFDNSQPFISFDIKQTSIQYSCFTKQV